MIDWPKLSELLLTGSITLVVGLILAYIGYVLGRKRSNSEWHKELIQREKEHQAHMQLLETQFRDQMAFQKDQFDEQKKRWEEEDKRRIRESGPGHVKWKM